MSTLTHDEEKAHIDAVTADYPDIIFSVYRETGWFIEVDPTSPTCDAIIAAIRADSRVSEFVNVSAGEMDVVLEQSPVEVFEVWAKALTLEFPDIDRISYSSTGAHLIVVNKESPTCAGTLFDLTLKVPHAVSVIPGEAMKITILPLHLPRPGLFQRIVSRLFGSASDTNVFLKP